MSYGKPKRGDPSWKPGAGIWRTCIRCNGYAPRGEMKQVKHKKKVAYQHRGDCLREKKKSSGRGWTGAGRVG